MSGYYHPNYCPIIKFLYKDFFPPLSLSRPQPPFPFIALFLICASTLLPRGWDNTRPNVFQLPSSQITRKSHYIIPQIAVTRTKSVAENYLSLLVTVIVSSRVPYSKTPRNLSNYSAERLACWPKKKKDVLPMTVLRQLQVKLRVF
jgi:hypothetical protein